MEVLISSLEVVLPLFIIMMAGWLAVRRGIISRAVANGLSSLVYWFLLPSMMFVTVVDSHTVTAADLWPSIWMSLGVILTSVFLLAFIPRIEKDHAKSGAIVQAIQRGNLTVYGLPFAIAVLGAGNLGNLGVILSIVVFVGNVLAALEVEIFTQEKVNVGRVLLGTIKNPIIIAAVLGFVCKGLGFVVPAVIMSPIRTLGGATSAVAFIALGGSFTMASTIKNRRNIILASLIKLVIQPLVFVLIGTLALGYRDMLLVALLCVFATPSPVSSTAMVKAMGGDTDLAGEIVAITTFLSIPTLFIFVYVFKLLGWV